jgi:hypothetical protein
MPSHSDHAISRLSKFTKKHGITGVKRFYQHTADGHVYKITFNFRDKRYYCVYKSTVSQDHARENVANGLLDALGAEEGAGI